MALPPENAVKTVCEHGHELGGVNLAILRRKDGRTERVCRTCANRRSREHRRRHYIPHPRVKKPPPEPKERQKENVVDRALRKIIRNQDGCWEWTGAKRNGYGIIQLGRGIGTARAHRVLYEQLKKPIPKGLDLMHVCHNRACVNPDHLVPGTRAENMAMSKAAGRLRRKMVHGPGIRT